MPRYPTFFSLSFVIHWFHTKLPPSHFTTKLRSWAPVQGKARLNPNFEEKSWWYSCNL